jgi:hypothetical protein
MLWKSWSMLWKGWGMLWKSWSMLWKGWGMLWKSWGMLWKSWGMLWKRWGMMRKPAARRLFVWALEFCGLPPRNSPAKRPAPAWSFGNAETPALKTAKDGGF